MSINSEFYAPLDYEANVPRSWHNLSTKVSTTMQTALLYPVYHRRMYAGDKFVFNPMSLLQTILPLNRPLLDCFELRFEYYFEPLSNLYGFIDNNTKESTDTIMTNSPKWHMEAFGRSENGDIRGVFGSGLVFESAEELTSIDYYLTSVNYRFPMDRRPAATVGRVDLGSLAQFMGMPGGFQGANVFQTGDGLEIEDKYASLPVNYVNLEPWLVYLDIIRCYHLNQQYELVPFSRGVSGNFAGNAEGNYYGNIDDIFKTDTFPTQRLLDDLFMELRYLSKHRNFDGLINRETIQGNNHLTRLNNWLTYTQLEGGGFFFAQYRPDLWKNLLSMDVGKNPVKVFTSSTDGSFTIDELRQKNKLQRFKDALDLSGGRYSNILRTVFGLKTKQNIDIPQLLHVTTHIIDPSNITAMAATTHGDESTELGQKASNVDKFNKGRSVTIKASVDGYCMVIASIVPRVGYSQGFLPNTTRLSMNDDFNPNFQNLGFQSVPSNYYALYPEQLFDSGDETAYFQRIQTSILGKNTAWIDEITDVSHNYGEFSSWGGHFKDMVLNREFVKYWLDPSSVDHPFIEDNPDGDEPQSYEAWYQKYGRTRFYISPYINPLEYNHIFSTRRIDESPWALHVAFNLKAKRPIGKRYRPNLE